MAKDWKQVAMAQKLVIAELVTIVREHEAWDKRQQKEYARLEKASLFYFREMERMRARLRSGLRAHVLKECRSKVKEA